MRSEAARAGGAARTRRRCGVLAHPGVEEAPLGELEIVAHHDADIAVAAAPQREAAQGPGLEPDQERNQPPDQKADLSEALSRKTTESATASAI